MRYESAFCCDDFLVNCLNRNVSSIKHSDPKVRKMCWFSSWFFQTGNHG